MDLNSKNSELVQRINILESDLIEKGNIVNEHANKLGKKDFQTSSISTQTNYYKCFFDFSPLPYFICNNELKIIDWNNASSILFGYSYDEIINSSVQTFLTTDADLNLLKSKLDNNLNNINFYTQNITKDNQLFYCLWNIFPTSTANNEICGFNVIINEISHTNNPILKDIDTLYKTIVENQSDGLAIIDNEDNILFANPALCDILNLEISSLLGSSIKNYILSKYQTTYSDIVKNRQTSNKVSYDIEIVQKLKGIRNVNITETSHYDIEGIFNYSIAVFRDYTDRKLIEQKLFENERRFRRILEFTHDFISIHDRNGKFIFHSPNISRNMKISNELIENINVFDMIYEDDKDKVLQAHKSVLMNPDLTQSVQFRITNPENGIKWYESIAVNLLDDPLINGVLISTRNITNRKKNEQIIIDKEKNFKTIIANANVLIFAFNKEGYITLSEGKALERFKFYPGQLVGLNVFEIFDDQQEVINSIFDTLNGQETTANLIIQSFNFETVFSPYININGELDGVVAISTDLTQRIKDEEEREKLIEELAFSQESIMEEANKLVILNDKLISSEEQLQLLNKQKDKFFSIISHDLRSPLSGLMVLSETLLNYFEKYSKNDLFHSIKTLHDTSSHLYKLLDNLLIWSRMSRGTITYEPIILNLKGIITNNITLLINNAYQKKITIEFSISNDISVLADENMLNTILRNLISNAIKFTYQAGNITISAIPDDCNFAEISITDNGVGISEEDLDKLFKLDVHHTSVGTNNEKGTGLGLLLCKEMIEIQGGKIFVQSQLNQGTTFTFTLPLSDNTSQIESKTFGEEVEVYNEIQPQEIHDEFMIDNLNSEEIQKIIVDLENGFLQKQEELLGTYIISDISDFSNNLKELAESYKFTALVNYANKLYERCSMMDIKVLDDLLNQFPEIISKLKGTLIEE